MSVIICLASCCCCFDVSCRVSILANLCAHLCVLFLMIFNIFISSGIWDSAVILIWDWLTIAFIDYQSGNAPPWLQFFNKELIRVVSFSDHEAFDHPVACKFFDLVAILTSRLWLEKYSGFFTHKPPLSFLILSYFIDWILPFLSPVRATCRSFGCFF